MRKLRWGVISAAVLAAAGSWIGCGKGDDSNPRYNEVIGGGAAPTGSRSDSGILKDPSEYKPAAVPGMTASGGGDAGGDAGAESPEKAEVEKVARAQLESLLAFKFTDMLETLDPQQVAALKTDECTSAAQSATDAMGLLIKEIAAKNADMGALIEQGLPKVANAIARSMDVKVTDAGNATANMNPEKAQAEFAAIHSEMAPLLAKLGVPGAGGTAAPTATATPDDGSSTPPAGAGTRRSNRMANPDAGDAPADGAAVPEAAPAAAGTAGNGLPGGGAGMPGGMGGMDPAQLHAMMSQMGSPEAATKFRKVDSAWKMDIGITLTESHAELYRDAMELIRGFATQAAGRISAVPSLTPESLQQIMTEAGMGVAPQAMGLMGKAQGLMMEAAANAAPPSDQPKAEPNGEKPAEGGSGVVIP